MKRYLLIHGYKQSGSLITKKVKPLIAKNSEIVAPNGSYIIGDDLYGWFPLEIVHLTNFDIKVNEHDINKILETFRNLNDTKYDGVIAFSQGCLIASLLLSEGIITTDKIILFSPIPLPNSWSYYFPTNLLAEIYIGERDDLVYLDLKFVELLNQFNVKIIKHRWGHVIPSTSEYKKLYQSFLN